MTIAALVCLFVLFSPVVIIAAYQGAEAYRRSHSRPYRVSRERGDDRALARGLSRLIANNPYLEEFAVPRVGTPAL